MKKVGQLVCVCLVMYYLVLPMETSARYLPDSPSSLGYTSLEAQDEEGATLEAVVGVIRESLKEAQENNVKGFPILTSVKISVNTVVTKQVSGGINFLVFSIGTKFETENSSTLELQMKPPPTTTPSGVSSVDPGKLKQALAQAVNLAKVAILNADQGTPKLTTNKVDIEIKFAVKVESTGGLKVVILPLGLEGSGKLARNKIHSVKMTFGA